MKVKELIDLLSMFNPESEVVQSNYDGNAYYRKPIESAEQVLSNNWDCDNDCSIYEVVLE